MIGGHLRQPGAEGAGLLATFFRRMFREQGELHNVQTDLGLPLEQFGQECHLGPVGPQDIGIQQALQTLLCRSGLKGDGGHDSAPGVRVWQGYVFAFAESRVYLCVLYA